MVLRKSGSSTDGTSSPSAAPYPITPSSERPPMPATSAFTSPSQIFSHDLHNSPAFSLEPLHEAQQSPVNTCENPWLNESRGPGKAGQIPASLKIGGPTASTERKHLAPELPSSLQVGHPSDAITPRSSSESERSHNFWDDDDEDEPTTSTSRAPTTQAGQNPQYLPSTSYDASSNAAPYPMDLSPAVKRKPLNNSGFVDTAPASAPPVPPAYLASKNPFRRNPSTEAPNRLSNELSEQRTGNSERPQTSANLSGADWDVSEFSTSYTPMGFGIPQQPTSPGGSNRAFFHPDHPLASMPQPSPFTSPAPGSVPPKHEQQAPMIAISSESQFVDQNPWSQSSSSHAPAPEAPYQSPYKPPDATNQSLLDQGFDQPLAQHRTGQSGKAPEAPYHSSYLQPDGMSQSHADQSFNQPLAQQRTGGSGQAPIPTNEFANMSFKATQNQPNLMDDDDLPPPKPPRPIIQVPRLSASELDQMQQHRSETYQIKHFNWADSKTGALRRSSMLVQNQNGPCPLLALVNALVLSSPEDSQSAIGNALASREQITLGLLIESLVDELMSDGKGMDMELPDVDDLNRFLLALRTGLNANPKFANTAAPVNLMDARNSMLHMPTPARESFALGTFEITSDIRLYGAFDIPLIHGWLPEQSQPAAASFSRTAQTYEDAQTVLFGEEELEARSSQGLSESERQLLQDILTIKDFLNTYPTQLTPHGLQLIHNQLRPGSFAILFRNDHFSTVFKHPISAQIFTLVTDAGYSSHDEIVWESLVDVSGQENELYSGDFRPVGNTPGNTSDVAPPPGPPPQHENTLNDLASPRSPQEQEQADADFALALQLQDEEERHAEEARRNRASSASAQSSSDNGRRASRPQQQDIRPLIPPRNSRQATSQQSISQQPPPRQPGVRQPTAPRVNPPRTNRPVDEDGEAPPPTYDEAAKGTPYIPPQDTIQYNAYAPPSGQPSSPYGGGGDAGAGSSQNNRRRTPSYQNPHQQDHARLQAQLGQPFGGGGGGGTAPSAMDPRRQRNPEEKCAVM